MYGHREKACMVRLIMLLCGGKKNRGKAGNVGNCALWPVNLVAADRLDVKSVDVGLHRDVFVQ